MYITRFLCDSFRNIRSQELVPDPAVNVICGKNAQGKTNFMEAVWLFTGEKSFRGAKDSDFLPLTGSERRVSMRLAFESGGRENEILFGLSEGKKQIEINGVRRRGVSALTGHFCAVIFSPEHLSLIKNTPNLRRSFLDNAICQIRPMFSKTLYQYDHTLTQRNSLLKDILRHPELRDTLEIWDERLAFYGSRIIRGRVEYLEKMKEYARQIYFDLSGGESLDLFYQSTENLEEEDLYASMIEKYRQTQREDIQNGFTTTGPHRDDIEFLIDGRNAKSFGSQGQQRSIVLSLKFSEARMLAAATGEMPVLLLDDVMSELDQKRQEYILNHIEGYQVIITCCDVQNTDLLEKGAVFTVSDGRIQRET